MSRRYRALTLAAVGFLGLDGALFLWLGRAIGRASFIWAAVACLVLAGAVMLAAREQRWRLEAITREREALKAAALELRELVRRR